MTQSPQKRPQDLDPVLKRELHWQAPPDLTRHLLGLVPLAPALMQGQDVAIPPVPHPAVCPTPPRSWYALLVITLTAIAVGLSLAIAWNYYPLLGSELGLNQLWLQLQASLSSGMQWLYHELPIARDIVALGGDLYQRTAWVLNWLLIAAVLWLALESSSTPLQPASSLETISQ